MCVCVRDTERKGCVHTSVGTSVLYICGRDCVHACAPCGICAFVCVAGYDFVVSPQHANARTAWTHSKGHMPLSPPNGSPVNTTLKVINLAPKDCGINLREH